MLVLSKFRSPIKKNQIPIIIAATEIIIVITISFLLLNFDKVDLVSLSEMGTHYIMRKKFLLTLSYPTYNILLFSRVGGAKIAHLNSSALVKLVPGSLHTMFY